MIHVCSLNMLEAVVSTHQCSHVVTLINDETPVATPSQVRRDNHLKLSMNDIATERAGYIAPNAAHVETLIKFVHDWDREAPLVIHCWAGISRSTAAAFVTLCSLNPDADEHYIAQQLRTASQTATPNPRIIAFADQLLKRDGRMIAAIDAIGFGRMAPEGMPFALDPVMPAKSA